MKLTTHKKFVLIDIALIALCVCFFILYGSRFAVVFFCALSLGFIILRRIDFKKHVGLRRIVVACFIIFGVSFVIIEGCVISEMGAKADRVSNADYVIVLGSGLKGVDLSTTLRQRLDASVSYVSQNTHVPVIVSGGQGPGEHIPEAVAMRDYLLSLGISEDRIVLESQSTSTKENLLFSKSIIHENGIENPKIVIVTSDYHMFRAKMLARKAGFEAYGISSPSPVHLKPINMIREYFAMIKALL
ncbi:YdcF family protein [Paenibacillus sp. J2TS4]|uniref:YdcF family protein n=1 Tax=Paenibacillus sp. J2TS4 TaxID=2807194 RepID=UPI001B10D8EA|nr:YdcF family protein [Paenibacillus sp. J2TS4]GIP32785.1 hypothetical protein J2TS4_19950 [Paenibacillus sp. J2TS4]